MGSDGWKTSLTFGCEARNAATLAAEALSPTAYSLHGFLPHDSLRSLYERCDVLALLPLDEPFGMIFPEAAGLWVGSQWSIRRIARSDDEKKAST